MPRIALYTATTGRYEKPTEILSRLVDISDSVDCYRFIDTPIPEPEKLCEAGPQWETLQCEPRLPNDAIRSARAIKILGHPALAAYDVTVWIDNRVRLKIGVDELVERFLPSGVDIAAPFHSYHDSLSVEFDAVLDGLLDDPRRVREQRSAYEQFTPNLSTLPVYWTAILLRRNNDAVRRFNTIWWEQVLRYSRRDQLSFLYACRMVPEMVVEPFAIDNYESELHEWRKVSDVGRVRSAGLWRTASLKTEIIDTTKSITGEMNTRGKDVIREIMPQAFTDRARRLRRSGRGLPT